MESAAGVPGIGRVVVVLNGRSGGGRRQPAVRAAAARFGWSVTEVGPGADPVRLATDASADVLAVAGGDGTVAAVAGVAVARDLPLLVLPCGTRNHFAADAGLDTADLAGVGQWVARRVDVGTVNGRVFLNNVSIGFYGAMVSDPRYRRHRLAVTSRYLRRALLGGGSPLDVVLPVDSRVAVPPRVLTVLISNNAYSPGTAPGTALRPRLDDGVLWVHLLGVDARRGSAVGHALRTVVHLATGRASVAAWPVSEETLRLDRARVRVGVDGEAVELTGPLELRCVPGALRLLGPPVTERPLRLAMHV